VGVLFRFELKKIVRLLKKLDTPIVASGAFIVFLVLDGFVLFSYQLPSSSTKHGAASTTVEEASSSLAREPTAVTETVVSAQEEKGVRVVVHVVDNPVGLSVLEDGQYVYDQVADLGFSGEFEAEEAITVSAADAGAVQVDVDGQYLGRLGERSVGVIRTFTPGSES
jgi:hypothetical protein